MKKAIKVMDIAIKKQKANYDSVFIICGRERVGKSTLMLNMFEYCNGHIDHVALDKKEFIHALLDVKESGIVSFDEAGDGLFSRDAIGKFNKQLVKTYMVIGGKKLISFLVLPDFFLLDKYFREFRVRGLFYVYKRGRYQFYNPKDIAKIITKGDRYIPLNMKKTDSFPNYKGDLLKPYLKKKKEKIKITLQELNGEKQKKEISKKDKASILHKAGLTKKDIAKELCISMRQVYNLLNEGIVY